MQRSRGVTAAVRTTVGTTVVHTRLPSRTTVSGPLGPTVRTTVVHTRLPSRTTIGRPLGTAIRTTVVHTRLPSRTTVSGPLGTAIRTTVVHTRHSGRSAVGGALVLVRVLVGNHRCSLGRRRVPVVPSMSPVMALQRPEGSSTMLTQVSTVCIRWRHQEDDPLLPT
ncbi:hypothetical protein [Streptomyces sp. BH105]|uniref:hypothetical protein n=1 Tax=Streptomyces sp. BH105 TaxID=3410408 RepID=UPI003CE9945C